MSWFSDLETYIITGAQKLETSVITEVRAVWNKIEPDVVIGTEELATMALNTVEADIVPILTGAMSISAAVNGLIVAVEAAGKSVLPSLAETAITFAKQQLQAVSAPASTTPTTPPVA